MISDEKIYALAKEVGLFPDGELPSHPVEKFVDYQDLRDSLQDFARAIYEQGRADQRESDAMVCDAMQDAWDRDGENEQSCAAWHLSAAIRNNTGDITPEVTG